MEKSTLVDGMFYNEARESAPDFVLGSVSFSKDKFIKWLSEQEDTKGYVNVDIIMSKAGKPYAKLNTFKPKASVEQLKKEVTPEDMPF